MRAREADAVLPPQRATDRQRLEESPHATGEGNAHGLELLADGRRVGGDAHAENHAPLGDAVKSADDVGEHDRIAQGGQEHGRADAHPPRAGGHGREKGERLVPRPRGDRVTDPHGLEAGRLRALGHGQHRAPSPGRPDMIASRVGSRAPNSTATSADLDHLHHGDPPEPGEYASQASKVQPPS